MASGTLKRRGWGNGVAVTLPWTATEDGMMLIRAGSSTSSARTYLYIRGGDNSYPFATVSIDGALIGGSFPVKKDVSYSVDYQSNVGSIFCSFIPLT